MLRVGSNLGLKVLAFVIAVFLWWVAQGSSSIERGYDLPLVLRGTPDDLVLTEQTSSAVNVRVAGSRAVLRLVKPERFEYTIDVSGAKQGNSDFEIDLSHLDLPRGARIVSRSPAQVTLTFERRMSKNIQVRADVEGSPAPGYAVERIEIDPPRVRVSGAQREVQRISEVLTEPVDVNGLAETAEREARVSVTGRHVWVDSPEAVKVRIRIVPVPGERSGPVKEG